MAGLFRERVEAVVLFGEAARSAGDGLPLNVFAAGELRTAVFLARELAIPGSVVLFSPGCPSGGGAANYEERGAAFNRDVRDL
jgi:UDP-N-acetylmuramoylalanine--D-glutamate ligase